MKEHEPGIYLITGPMAAGKSTVARLLASRFERGVYLEGDAFRRSILTGREEMTPDPSPEAEDVVGSGMAPEDSSRTQACRVGR